MSTSLPNHHKVPVEILSSDSQEDILVEEFGYAPTYRRVFASLGSMSLTIAMASPTLGAFVMCTTQVTYGGYWGLTWGWFIPALLFLPWALATAELCSSMPVNGANYWWTAALAPPSVSRPLSFVAGMTNVMSAITSMASFSWAIADSIMTLITIYTGWEAPTGSTFGVAIAVSLMWLGMVCFRMQDISTLFIINSTIVLITTGIFIIGMPASQAAQGIPFTKASDVFGSYKNYSDWDTPVALPMTFFAVAWVVTGWNAPASVAEETHNARVVAPRSIVSTYSIMAILGFIVCVILAFCITDMDAAAADETGFPAYSLVMERWGHKWGIAYLMIIVLNTMFGGASVLVMMSCQIAAFARDGGLVFNEKLAYVHAYSNMPIYSSIFVTVGGILMLLFSFSPIASTIIYSLSVLSVMLLYIIPMAFRLFDGGRWRAGVWNLGKFSKPIHAWSIVSVLYMVIMECFPPEASWTSATLNYNWIVLLGATILSTIFWFTLGSRSYRGPDQEFLSAWRAAHENDSASGVDPVLVGVSQPTKPSEAQGSTRKSVDYL